MQGVLVRGCPLYAGSPNERVSSTQGVLVRGCPL